jgi:iron complex outermembrane recepter protein
MKRTLLLSMVAASALMSAETEATIGETIITATKIETAVEDAPGSVSVVTKKDINMLSRPNIKETVRNLEGVTAVQSRGQSDIGTNILLRGIPNQSRTMIMVDGVPMNTSYAGQSVVANSIYAEDLKQVEIVRGPFSSLYGSSAIGGVVNFITAMPDKSEYSASIGYGNAFEDGKSQKNIVKGYVSAAEKIGNDLKVKVSYGFMNSDGYRSDDIVTAIEPVGVTGYQRTNSTATGGTQYVVGNKGRGVLDKYDASVRTEYKVSGKDTIDASYRRSYYRNTYTEPESYLKNASGATVFSTGSAFASGINELVSHLYTVGWNHNFDNAKFSAKYSDMFISEVYTTARDTAATTRFGGVGTVTPRVSQNSILDLTFNTAIGNSMWLVGSQYKLTRSVAEVYNATNYTKEHSTTTQQSSSGGKERVIALFSDLQTEWSDSLSTAVGARYEWWRGYDGYTHDFVVPANSADFTAQNKFNISPKASINYKVLKDTMLKTSWGRGFRAPDALNLYRNYTSGTVTYYSNPALKPELSESYDFGIEQKTSNGGLAKAYWFHTEIKDMIYTKYRNLSGSQRDRVNVGKTRSEGYELSYVQPLPYDFAFSTNFTKNYTRVLENEATPATVGKRLIDIPETMANAAITYDNKKFYSSLAFEHKSRLYFSDMNSDVNANVYGSYDPYEVFNLKVGYRFNKNAELSLAITNLFDRDYYSYVQAERRAWYTQLNVKF